MTMSRRKKRGPQPSYPLSVKQAAVRRVEAGESLFGAQASGPLFSVLRHPTSQRPALQ